MVLIGNIEHLADHGHGNGPGQLADSVKGGAIQMLSNYGPSALLNKRSQLVHATGSKGPLHETTQPGVVGGVTKEEGSIVDAGGSNVL
ncbi:unannotated protein [freshwater metagenome]|uniref:Unannotated protein n=1 Tax=freshwater metagenome TaxID=449393 RepID=A0A6J6WHX3_9ZZZZ